MQKPPVPGDTIIDFYMPHASPAEREEARHNLTKFVELIALKHTSVGGMSDSTQEYVTQDRSQTA
jgi:hypothetical protein